MPASTLLSASRRSSGLSQAELASRAHTSQPDISSLETGRRVPTFDTLERLLLQTGRRIVAVPNVGPDADETAVRILSVLRDGGSGPAAFRAFLDYSDGLARADGTSRVLLSVSEPRPTGSPAWDAALAGLVDYRLASGRLPRPEWISAASRTLAAPASPHLGRYDLEPDPSDVPAEFARRNVLIERSSLASV